MPVRTEVPWGDTVPEQPGLPPPASAAPGLAPTVTSSTAPGLAPAVPSSTAPGLAPAVPSSTAAAAGSDPDPFIGRVVDDRYRIIERLGEGGMGTVYVAEHLKLRKQVAVKTILPEFASNPQIEARFAREALATASLDHPHVASALDFGHFPDGGAYLVIQLVRGVTLARHLDAHGRLPWGLAVELGAQIADALAAAHAAGVVHRDLKPDNILLEPRDEGRFHAKVVDFGIARLSEETSAPARGVALTRVGAILGTPGYMAPEQAVGQPVDARGDLYSLGVILWECCIGRRLWQGESVNELVACQLRSTPPTLQQELGSRVPEALSALVAQLLSSSPNKRPAAAAPVRDALRHLAQSAAPSAAGAQPPIGRGLPAALVPAPPPWSLAALRRQLATPRGRVVAVGSGVALLVLVALIARCGVEPVPQRTVPPAAPSPPRVTPPPAPTSPPAVIAAPAPAVIAAPAPAVIAAPAPALVAAPALIAAPAPPAADEPPLPAALAEALTALLGGDAKARKRAAERVLAHQPADEVPAHLRHLAALEKASSCHAKRGVLEKMDAAADPRVLPALRRLSATRRRGCGFFNAQDCFECLREPLARLIGRLDAAVPRAAD